MKLFKIAGILLLVVVVIAIVAALYVKTALPDVGPAPDITIAHTPQRLERGRYLANHVAVCMDCHSTRNWQLYAGPIAPGNFGGGGEAFTQDMGFPGTFYAPNITPHRLGNWTDGELLRAITAGVTKTGTALFPLMAYHRFGRMDREDVYSIVAYLRTLDPVPHEVPASKPAFPFNILINTMPAPATFQPLPDPGNTVAYGGYLVNAAGCVDCHSKQNNGETIAGTELGGGMEFKQPGGILRSPNITFDPETGIGNWSKEAFIGRFTQFADSNYTPAKVGPDERNTPMRWAMYAGMKKEDLAAIFDYLKSIKPIVNKVPRL